MNRAHLMAVVELVETVADSLYQAIDADDEEMLEGLAETSLEALGRIVEGR